MFRERAQQQKNQSSLPLKSNARIQRKCDCGKRVIGTNKCSNCSDNSKHLQRRTSIEASNSSYEKEADDVANRVLSMPLNSKITPSPLKIQRLAHGVKNSRENVPRSVNRVLADPGIPMNHNLRSNMEHRFGYDFSNVRIHTGSLAEQSAKDINANAYTSGNKIVFGAGQYRPETVTGKKLLAHELTHVVQQNNADIIHNSQSESGRMSYSNPANPAYSIQGQAESKPSTDTSDPFESTTQMETVRPGSEPRIEISCADMRLKIYTPSTIYSYRLDECSIPINSYVASVTISGKDFYLNFGDSANEGEEFSFRYIVDPGQENPVTLLEGIGSIHVDVVDSLAPPRTTPQDERRQSSPTQCVVRLPDRELFPGNSATQALFETKSFSQTIWAHPIPLGQFGWVEVEASASGGLSGNLSGSYDAGTLSDICLTHMIDRNTDSTAIDHPLLGEESTATITTFNLGGRARFKMDARAAATLSASGTLRIAGDYLSAIELAAAEASLTAQARANLNGSIDASAEIIAEVSLAEAYLQSPMSIITGIPNSYLPRDLTGITIQDINVDGIDLAAEIGLQGRAGVAFRGDLSAGFSLAGIDLWSQSWNLANFNAGVSWNGGLRYSSGSGVEWDLGSFNVGNDSDIIPLSTDVNTSSAEIDEDDVIQSILDETQSQVTSPDGSNESQALPFDWFKPDSLYPENMDFPNAISPTSIGRFDGPTTVRFPTAILPTRDRRHYGLPRGSALGPRAELEEYIGVADWPSINRKFQYMPYDSRSDPEKERFKRLVDALGFNRSGFDADHIWELGLLGPDYDRFDNLWPGSNQEQQLAGARHHRQMVNYENTLGNINGRWFVITRIRHPA